MLRVGAGLLAAVGIFLLVAYTTLLVAIVVAVVLFVIAAVLVAVYMLAAKKPEVEHHGNWTLDKVRGKND